MNKAKVVLAQKSDRRSSAPKFGPGLFFKPEKNIYGASGLAQNFAVSDQHGEIPGRQQGQRIDFWCYHNENKLLLRYFIRSGSSIFRANPELI